MAVAIKLIDGKVPEVCLAILTDIARHKDECLDCTMASLAQSPFEAYCTEGQVLLVELSNQPEVTIVE